MIDVDCADMCSNQRGLRRKISRVENGVTVNVIGLQTQIAGELDQKDLVSQMKRLQKLPKKKKVKVPCSKCNKTESKEKYFPYCCAEHWGIAVRAEPE